ncbi:hypothetical protein Aura_00164 [Pseudomonas phage vB_PpuM-Aura]
MKSMIRRKDGFYTELLAGAKDPVALSKTAFNRGLTRIVASITSSVKLRYVVDSETGDAEYRVRVKFQKSQLTRKGTPAIKVGRVLVPVDLDSIAVHCTCQDFRFTWYTYLKNAGHAAGWFKQVELKGSGRTREADHAGCCKHIAGVLAMVEQNVIVKL